MKNTTFVSTYLDLLRVLAASMVVLFHFKVLSVGPPALVHRLPGFGHEFVIVFFVLSGYVVSWSADRKRGTLGSYALDRACRIFAVSVPLLLLSALLSITLSLGTIQEAIGSLVANLVFAGQCWWINSFPATNPTFWSLNYEVWYYALFGCAFYLRGSARILWCVVVSLLAGPKILVLLPCWLLGAAIYFAPARLGRAGASAVAVASIGCLVVAYIAGLGRLPDGANFGFPLGQSHTYAKDWIVAIFVAIHVYAIRHLEYGLPAWLATAAKRGAAVTFTLYLINYPVILAAKAVFGASWNTLGCATTAVVSVSVATALIAAVTEAQTGQLRGFFQRRFLRRDIAAGGRPA